MILFIIIIITKIIVIITTKVNTSIIISLLQVTDCINVADECILYIFILHDQPQHKHHCQHRILQVTDCINVADECICAITQLLPALYEFNLQVSAIVNIALIRIILIIKTSLSINIITNIFFSQPSMS